MPNGPPAASNNHEPAWLISKLQLKWKELLALW
jgi:hypothetical protein